MSLHSGRDEGEGALMNGGAVHFNVSSILSNFSGVRFS